MVCEFVEATMAIDIASLFLPVAERIRVYLIRPNE